MSFASYYEDNQDAIGERDKRTRYSSHAQPKDKEVKAKSSNYESQFRLRRSTDSTRTPSSKPPRRKKSRPKPPQPKSLRRKELRPKLSRWKPLRRKTAPDARQHIRREEPLKIQPVTTEELQQRIQREVTRQQEGERYR